MPDRLLLLYEGGELVKTYLLSVAAAAILIAVVQSLLPKGTMQKIAAFSGGLLVILSVLSPFLKLEYADMTRAVNKIATERETFEASYQNQWSAIIKDRCETYILDKAKALGLTLDVEVELGERDGYPYPSAVTLKGAFSQALSDDIAENLDIPPEKQEWIAM